MRIACPRRGCDNLMRPDQAVCSRDFTLLAGSCRGKKALGQPIADMIEADGGGAAYSCELCRMYHNGGVPRWQAELDTDLAAVLDALRADPRVGQRGLLRLAERWRPPTTKRSDWSVGLDQSEAFAPP